MNCPVCGQESTVAGTPCPRCGHVESPWSRPDDTVPIAPAPEAAPAPAPTGFGDPSQYLAAHPERKVDSYPVAVRPPRKRRLLAVLIGALVVVLIGGGVAVAGGMLGWFGGGKRPSDVLPGSAISYAQIDLDPSLLQKTAAWQFLRDVPEVKTAVARGLPDPNALLWQLLVKNDDSFAKYNFETEIKPWLGNRYGAVALNHSGKPAWAAAVQVTDEELGATTLRSWVAKAKATVDVTIRDGYALLTDSADTAFVLAELATGTLSNNPAFAGDFAALGEPGISAGWTDLGALTKLQGKDIGSAVGVSTGRLAFATRFTADTLEVAGISRGFTGAAVIPDGDLGALPADTGAAISLTGAGKAIAQAWAELPREAKDSVAGFGLDVPDDLVALLGNSLTVSASTDTIQQFANSSTPEIGLRVNSDDAARAETVLQKLGGATTPPSVFTRVDGSVLVAGTTAAYRDRIAGGGARLADQEWFAKAVPDHASASFAAWLDLAAVLRVDGVDTGDYREFTASLRGWGVEFVPGAAGEGAWSARLVRA